MLRGHTFLRTGLRGVRNESKGQRSLARHSNGLNASKTRCRTYASDAPSKAPSQASSNGPPNASTPVSPKLALPERIIVYHAGTGKIVFVACMKLTTVFMSILGCFFGTNVIFGAPDEPVWLGPLIIAGGCVPLLTVGLTTSPFVAMVHLRAPTAARASKAVAARWAEHLPRSTDVYCTTLGLIGMRRIYRTVFSDLRRKKPAPWWNIANLVVDPAAPARAGGLARFVSRQQGQFFIGNQKMMKGWQATAWRQLWERIPWL